MPAYTTESTSIPQSKPRTPVCPKNLQKLSCRSLIDAADTNPLAKIGMPAILDLNFIADIGRMNGQRL